MKIFVKESFKRGDKQYEKGQTVDLPEKVAKKVIEKGYGEKAEQDEEDEKIEKIENSEPSRPKGEGPAWKRKLWISEDRNLTITIWPAGEKFDSPSVTLEESRREDSGDWTSNRTYLPTGSSLLALSENLKSAWEKIQEIRAEEKQ